MDLLLGLQFNSNVLGPSIVLGIAVAGLYGLLAMSLVLTYRVSRTIGFVQGGIAVLATYLYSDFTFVDQQQRLLGGEPKMGKLAGMLLIVALGALLGTIYGATVTSRKLAGWPRVNLTTYSLGWLILLFGVQATFFSAESQLLPSVFGDGFVTVWDANISHHKLWTLGFLVALMVGLAFVLARTQTGIYIRAIADDVDAARMVGVSMTRVGMGVYAFAGATSALAGVLLASAVGTAIFTVIVVFLRALTMSVLGGMTSFYLAIAGCLLLGVGETAASSGLFGTVSEATREIFIMTSLFLLVFVINRIRPIRAIEAAGL